MIRKTQLNHIRLLLIRIRNSACLFLIMQPIKKRIQKMWDKVSPEYLNGALSFGLAAIMALLRVLGEEGQRTLRGQVLEVLICGFLGLAAFTMCKALDVNEYWAFTIGIMVGHFGSIRVRILAMKMINRNL